MRQSVLAELQNRYANVYKQNLCMQLKNVDM